MTWMNKLIRNLERFLSHHITSDVELFLFWGDEAVSNQNKNTSPIVSFFLSCLKGDYPCDWEEKIHCLYGLT